MLGSLPLALRRRWPSAVFGVMLGAWLVIELLRWNQGVVPACVLFASASWQPLKAALACLAALYAQSGVLALQGGPFADPLSVFTLLGLTIVWASGLSVRHLRQRQQQAVARALVVRLVQEALTNVRKHAPGARAWVDVAADGGDARIEIGNDVPTPGPRGGKAAGTGGYGLIGMRERVAMFDGRLDVGPSAGGGYRVRAVLRDTSGRAAFG
ncbi:ATP-binding protein [Dactylosporangium sp. CS-047395]|uniref:ATP-binding protein n=1 Tax=Dactylosporangium sp. CS-047395 TaxID=3239936 RepID=UPI003D8F9D79